MNAIAQRTKSTLGIADLTRVHRREVWHLDVGSSHPGRKYVQEIWAVRPLKAVRELGSERRGDSSVISSQAQDI